jgi:alpha-mannosidase
MIFDSAGTALQGITGVFCPFDCNEVADIKGGFDYNRRVEYIIPHKEVVSGKCVRYIEVSANGMFGAGPQDDVRVS